MIACHCHFTEEQIDNFSYIFYKDIIKELGVKFGFESIRGLSGDSYCEKRMEIIEEANPFNYRDKSKQKPKPTLNMMRNFGLL